MTSRAKWKRFLDLYELGKYSQAFQCIITDPEPRYERGNEEEIEKRSINFIDASIFKTPYEAIKTGEQLVTFIRQVTYLNSTYIQFVNLLQYNLSFEWALTCKQEKLIEIEEVRPELKRYRELIEQKSLTLNEITHFLNLVEDHSKKYIESKLVLKQRLNDFQNKKSELCQSLHVNTSLVPHHIFAFPSIENHKVEEQKEDGTVVLFFEPIENFNYDTICTCNQSQERIVVFHRESDFFQAFQFEQASDILNSPHTTIYILDRYPLDQFRSQKTYLKNIKKLKPITLLPRKGLQDILSTFLSLISTCLLQDTECTEEANCLYQMAQQYLYIQDVQKYGASRFFAVHNNKIDADWFDCNKGIPCKNIFIHSLYTDPLETIIKESSKKRTPRPLDKRRKKRVAHVVAQIVDGGHAPSTLVRSLLYNSNTELFDSFLISTEMHTLRAQEYPWSQFFSLPSQLRGQNTVLECEKKGIKLQCVDIKFSYKQIIQEVISLLKQWEIDVVVFHGDNFIHSTVGSACDVPVRVFFDHGTLPKYIFFDQMVLSSFEAETHCRQQYQKKSISIHCLPFSIDAKAQWEKDPYTKQFFSLEEDSFVMTTISNHLDSRLSSEMCYAISEILKQNPKAIYAPIGPVNDIGKFQKIFQGYGIDERVCFLGPKPNPSQCVRSMQLYLNEFPFGSGLAILQAMASGCPVVSMYNEEGPQQGRYGGVYFGKDHVISSLKVEEYIDVACRLIQDQKMYREWSQHAVTQYEKRANVKQYVSDFESIISNTV